MNPAADNHQDIRQNGARIGYVLKVYPRFSETFIVTEILAREAQGEDLSIYALRPTRTRASTPRSPGYQPGSAGWVGRYAPSTCGASSPTV